MKPRLQALLLADHVYEDKTTGKKIIAGVFHNMWFKRGGARPKVAEKDGVKQVLIPGGGQAGSPYAYLSLTDIRGARPFVLRYVDLEDDTPVFQCEFEIRSLDPLSVAEVVLPLPSLPMNKAGIYALELLCDNEPLGSFRIHVREIQEQGDNDGN